MHIQIKRKLAPITRAKLHILHSNSMEAMMVKRAIFYGRKDMPLSINGAKLGVLIWASKALCLLPNLEENGAITTIQTCKKVSRHGAEVKYATLELVSYFDLYFPLVLNYLQSLCSCYE